MNLTCNLCDCTLPLAYDRLKSENNLNSHFNGNRHKSNYEYNVGRSWTINCNLCDLSCASYFCTADDAFNHLRSTIHSDNLVSYECGQYPFNDQHSYSWHSSYDVSSEEEDYEGNYEEEDEEDYEVSDSEEEEEEEEYDESFGGEEFEQSFEDEEEYELSSGEDESESSNEVNHSSSSNHENFSSLFYCHLCECKVPISIRSIQSSKEQIMQHITGKRHQDNLQDDNNTNNISIQCNICQCNIPLSYDVSLSLRNISVHVGGNRHHQNLPPEENDKCYSSPIHVPD